MGAVSNAPINAPFKIPGFFMGPSGIKSNFTKYNLPLWDNKLNYGAQFLLCSNDTKYRGEYLQAVSFLVSIKGNLNLSFASIRLCSIFISYKGRNCSFKFKTCSFSKTGAYLHQFLGLLVCRMTWVPL